MGELPVWGNRGFCKSFTHITVSIPTRITVSLPTRITVSLPTRITVSIPTCIIQSPNYTLHYSV